MTVYGDLTVSDEYLGAAKKMTVPGWTVVKIGCSIFI